MTSGVLVINTRGREASERLARAISALAAQGLRHHCSDETTAHYWLSEHDGERAQAALWCHGCPVIVECGEAAQANKERWGVWSGRDFSNRRPKKLGRPPKQAA